jgi:acyl transferase domain-containing protein/acyl carrier protein
LAKGDQVLLEVGPGRTLGTFARQQQAPAIFTSLRHPRDEHADRPFLLTTLGRLWLCGLEVDWRAFYDSERRRRVPLPPYPFARERYWIEPPGKAGKVETWQRQSLDKKPDMADWFYVPSWKRTTLPDSFEPSDWAEQKLCWLVFLDECGLGSQLVKRLKQANQDVITVIAGEAFGQVSERVYVINPRQRDDYDTLIRRLGELDEYPHTIVHLWGVTAPEHTPSGLDHFERSQELGFYSLLFLAQVLEDEKRSTTDPLHIGVVSNNIQEVIGDEWLCPEKATLLGPCQIIPREYENITCCSIDIVMPEPGTWQEEVLIERLVEELAARSSDTIVAYRGKHRWVQTFEPVRLDGTKGRCRRLRQGGVYLITGGLGGIGLVLAEDLAQTVQAKLVLIGRSAFPAKDEWEQWLATHDDQNSTSRKIKKLEELEDLGAEVLALSADTTDQEQMQAVVDRAHERFGTVHGVIHAAGIAGGGIIQLKTPEIAARVLEPKVKGTLVLDAIFKDAKLDFFVLFSSLTSILGEFGQSDYCAANAFLDAFARRNASRHTPFTVSINWDAWQKVGMAVDTVVPLELRKQREENIKQGLLPQEGVDALGRILSCELSQVLVSTRDFHALLEQGKALTASDLLEELEKARSFRPTYPRPVLDNVYVAPTSEVEQLIAGMWQDFLGVDQVGIYDNFFELGGHSLLLVQMQNRLQTHFGRDISIVHLFEHPTIHDLAEYLSQTQIQEQGSAFAHIEERGQKYRAALKRQRRPMHRPGSTKLTDIEEEEK